MPLTLKWFDYSWTEFEVQALAYGILRKALFPEFMVRGEYCFKRDKNNEILPLSSGACFIDIAIFRQEKERTIPKPVLLIEVKKGTKSVCEKQGKRYSTLIGVPCVYVRGQQEAYNVMTKVYPYIEEAYPELAFKCLIPKK